MMVNLVAPTASASAAPAPTAEGGAPDSEFLACLESQIDRLAGDAAEDETGQLALALASLEAEAEADAETETETEGEADDETIAVSLMVDIASAAPAETTTVEIVETPETETADPESVEGAESAAPVVETAEIAAAAVAAADEAAEVTAAADVAVDADHDGVRRTAPVDAPATASVAATSAEGRPTAPASPSPVTSSDPAPRVVDAPEAPATPEAPTEGDAAVPAIRPVADSSAPTVSASASSTTHVAAPDAPTDVEAAVPSGPTPDVEDPWEQLATVVRPLRTAADGSQRLSLQLRPAELGTVHLEISVDDGVLSLRAVAETTATREALTAALPELRSELTRSGLSLGTVDVGPDTSGGDDPTDGRREPNAADQRLGRTGAPGSLRPVPAPLTLTATAPGRLDLVI